MSPVLSTPRSSDASRRALGAADRSPRAEPTPGLVLVVDDEPLLLRALERILVADGHRLVLAASVADADDALRDPALDVVLVDLVMHGARVSSCSNV